MIGLVTGHFYDQSVSAARRRPAGAGTTIEIGEKFFTATFEVMGHVAKADGRVSEAEVAAARKVMSELRLDGAQVHAAIHHFTRGKNRSSISATRCRILRASCAGHPELIRVFLELQVRAALEGVDMQGPARAAIQRVAESRDVSRLELAHMEASCGCAVNSSLPMVAPMVAAGCRPGAAAIGMRLEAAYQFSRSTPRPATKVSKAYRRQLSNIILTAQGNGCRIDAGTRQATHPADHRSLRDGEVRAGRHESPAVNFGEAAVLVGLILLHRLLAGSELALVSARKARLKSRANQGHLGAKMALRLLENPTQLLSTVQIGITLIGILTGVYSGATFAEDLAVVFKEISWLELYAHETAFTLVVIVVTYLSLILGELVPKRVALAHAESIAGFVAIPMHWVARIFWPLVWLLKVSTEAITRLLPVTSAPQTSITEDEIRTLVAEGAKEGVFHGARRTHRRCVLLADMSVEASWCSGTRSSGWTPT